MSLKDYLLEVDIYEKDVIEVELVEKEILTCELTTVDIINYVEKTIAGNLLQEVPTKISAIRFQTSQAWVSGSLKVFFNGLKVKSSDITTINTTTFEISDTTISSDSIEVEYLTVS